MQLKKQFIALMTIAIKEILRIFRIWKQTLLPPVVTMTLYFIVFGKMIGSQIHPIGNFSYMQYITPGLIMMPVITAAYINSSTTFFMAKFQRSIEELLISPTLNVIILLGFISGSVVRALVIAGLVTIVSMFFTHLQVVHGWITLTVIFLSAVLFSLAGLINGILATKFDDVSFVPNFILTPLTYLGGVFYSIKLLPSLWQHVSVFNPILYVVNAFRYGLLGISDVNMLFAFLVILFFIILLFVASLWLLYNGVGLRK